MPAKKLVLVLAAFTAAMLAGCAAQSDAQTLSSDNDLPMVTTYDYDEAGNCTKEETTLVDSGERFLLVEREYSDAGQLVSETRTEAGCKAPFSSKDTYSYEDGSVAARESCDYVDGAKEPLVKHYTYTRTEENGVTRVAETQEGDDGAFSVEYYDQDGRLVQKARFGVVDGKRKEIPERDYSYDENGKLLLEVHHGSSGDEEFRYELNDDGECARVILAKLESGESYLFTENEFGTDGLVARTTSYGPNGQVRGYRTFRYDDQGRPSEIGWNCEV